MSNRLSELCSALVENAYGHLASQIFSSLADHGRQTLPALHQLTRLPLRRLKTGLGILIQHHILLHYRKNQGEEDEDDREPTYFQVDWDAAYCLLRARKMMKLVIDREGEAAGRLLANVLQLGHASIGDLAAEYDFAAESKRDTGIEITDNHVNGVAKEGKDKLVHDKLTTASHLHSLTRTLLKGEYLIKVGPRTYLPKHEFQDHLAQTVMSQHFTNGKVTAKQKAAYKASFNELKRKYNDEDSYKSLRDDASHGTIKRAESPPRSIKRLKLNGNVPNGVQHRCGSALEDGKVAVARLPDDMIVRVNFKKCTTLLRSMKLEQMATNFLGPITGAVYGAVLQSLAGSVKYVSPRDTTQGDSYDSDDDDDEINPAVSDLKVLENLDKSINLESTIKRYDSTKLPNGDGNHRKRARVLSDDSHEAELGIKREAPSEDEDDNAEEIGIASLKARNSRLNLLNNHLNLLAEHPKGFITRVDGRHESRIDMTAVINRLIQYELDTMIQARFGKHGMRVVRLLREKGKLDDKQLCTYAMLDQKYLRSLLLQLQFAGLLDIQEVPKDNTRQPPRTLYLWSFDEERAQSVFLQQTYHTMLRLMERVQVERDGRFRAVIEKAEHAGVKGKEEATLGTAEREMLRQWREVEEKLLVQVARCDEVVAVLRDFGADDGALTV